MGGGRTSGREAMEFDTFSEVASPILFDPVLDLGLLIEDNISR